MALIDRQSQTLKTVSQLVVDVNKMAPYVPEEVNVFSVPHSRMKELVNSYFTLVGRWGCLFILWKSLRAMYYLPRPLGTIIGSQVLVWCLVWWINRYDTRCYFNVRSKADISHSPFLYQVARNAIIEALEKVLKRFCHYSDILLTPVERL